MRVWDFMNTYSDALEIKHFTPQELYAAICCQDIKWISLIDIFSSIVKVFITENKRGIKQVFSRLHPDDFSKVWPELLGRLWMKVTKNESLGAEFYQWLRYVTPETFTHEFTPGEKVLILNSLIDNLLDINEKTPFALAKN